MNIKTQQIDRYVVGIIAGVPIDMFMGTDGEYYTGASSLRIALMSDPAWACKALLYLNERILCPDDFKSNPFRPLAEFKVCNAPHELDAEELLTIKDLASLLLTAIQGKPLPASVAQTINRSSQKIEQAVQDRLCRTFGGSKEVKCGAGFIDLLTDTEIIEIKRASKWKSAVGQILAYGNFYPSHAKRIHLFDVPQSFDRDTVELCCESLGISVSYE